MSPEPKSRSVLVEACVTTREEAVGSVPAGAGRLELCVDLDVGGLTPPPSLTRSVRVAVDVPVIVMIRPEAGSFVAGEDVVRRMELAIDVQREAGASGFVLGVLRPDGRVEEDLLRRLVERAAPLPVTFHRAFDAVPDFGRALETLVDAGVTRVLTSGGAPTALDGADVLAGLVEQAGDRIVVMPGGRVRAGHVRRLVAGTGAREVHARAEAVADLVRAVHIPGLFA